MITPYTITGAAWTAITSAGESLRCWLDEEGDGSAGAVEVRIVHSATGTPLDSALTSAKKIYRPGGNNDFLSVMADSESDVFYARCLNQDDEAILQVDSFLDVTLIKQNVIADSGNSSTDNLDASNSYTFTGEATSTLGVVGIQWSLKTDQNATICVDESSDGINWDITYCFDYIESEGGIGETIQATAAYYRIRVVLLREEATTYFRLQSVLCPFATPLPSALTEDRRLKVEAHVSGQNDNHVWVTERNNFMTARHVRLVGSSFDGGTKDTTFWTETTANGGTVTQAGGLLTLRTNTTPDGSASYESVSRARFVAGTTQMFIVRVTGDLLPEGNLIRSGAYDANNGFFFQVKDTVFAVGTRIGGVDTIVSDGNFNGVYGANYPPLVNTYFSNIIEWTPTGVLFFVEGKLLHRIDGEVLSNTSSLPIKIENVNSGGATNDVSFKIAEAAIMRSGELITGSTYFHISGNAATYVLKSNPGTLQKIIFNNTSGTSITIYDNSAASGKVIGIITTSSAALGSWEYNIPFSTGLTIVTTGNSLDATVVFE